MSNDVIIGVSSELLDDEGFDLRGFLRTGAARFAEATGTDPFAGPLVYFTIRSGK
jgi:hypothetical protein